MSRWRPDITTWANVGGLTRDVCKLTVGETSRWRNDRFVPTLHWQQVRFDSKFILHKKPVLV